MGFLTRLIAGLTAAAALGAGLAGTANAVDVTGAAGNTKSVVKLTADGGNNLPDHIVNGNFEYPVKSDMPVNDGNFWYISQNDGSYFANGTVLGKRYKLPEGFDKAKFAWHSTQTGDTYYPDLERADDVQVDYTADGTNHYSEISAAQSGATIYQDVATVPGVMYKWSLKHASLDSSYLDKMSVIIGEPGKETAQEATRTTANGHGDKLGKVGTVISTKVSNPEMPAGNKFQEGAHTGQWETYTGTYIATGTVTRFTFRSVEGYSAWDGNLLDDISFSKAYKLTYDKNASDATGSVPSDTTANTVKQAKADATGTVKTVTDTKTKTSGTVKTVADTNASLPDHLVNGDFNVNYHDQWKDSFGGWTSIDPNAGKTLHATSLPNGSSWKWTAINGWDKSKFGWTSTQKAGSNVQQKANAVELQYDDSTADNVYAELCAYEAGTAIYQDIRTVPGTLYKVRLRHASLNQNYLDKMQVMIGTPGHEQPVEMTRTSVNGHGDKLNEKSTTIATKVTNGNNRHHADQWETYEGTYLIPDGQTTTRFTFKSIDAKQLDYGNVLDDIVFDKAYRLSYDKNASDATGKVPSNQRGKENTVEPAKAKTTGTVKTVADENVRYGSLANGDFSYPSFSDIQKNEQETPADLRTFLKSDDGTLWYNMSATDFSKYGKIGLVQRTTTHEDGSVTVKTIDTSTDVVSGCQVYYPAGQRITLATMAKDDDCWDSSMLSRPGHTQLGWNQDRNATQAQAQVTMVEGGMTVYAVWVGNPVLTYDTNKPSTWSGQMPSTPASISVPYNTAAADGSGWRAGDTTKIRGYRFLGWYTGPQDNAGLYDWTRPLTGSVTVYAHWQRLQANVVYNANGGTGSHPNTTGWQYSDVTIPGDTSKSFKHDGLYLFKHWNTQPNDQGTVYTDGSRIALQDKDITLYAIWVPYHEHFVPTGGIGLPIAIAGGVLLLMFGIGSTVMLTRRMNGHGMPDDE